MIKGVHHIAISTNNLDGLLHFYRDLLGMKAVNDVSQWRDDKLMDNITGLQDTRGSGIILRPAGF